MNSFSTTINKKQMSSEETPLINHDKGDVAVDVAMNCAKMIQEESYEVELQRIRQSVRSICLLVGGVSSQEDEVKTTDWEKNSAEEAAHQRHLVYSCLVARECFQRAAEENTFRESELMARADKCEMIAIELLDRYDISQRPYVMSHILLREFPTLQGDGTRKSCMDEALTTSSRIFFANPKVADTVEEAWFGNLKPPGDYEASPHSAQYAPVSEEDHGLTGLIMGNDRLHVPRNENFVTTVLLLLYVVLYSRLLIQRSHNVTKSEVVYFAWALGYAFEEFSELTEAGLRNYLTGAGNFADVVRLTLNLVLFYIRFIFQQDQKNSLHVTNFYWNLFACVAPFLWIRALGALTSYEYFGSLYIAIRSMVADFLRFLAVTMPYAVGFSTALAGLRVRKGIKDPNAEEPKGFWGTFYFMLSCFVGNTDFDIPKAYHPQFGPILYNLWLIVASLLLMNLLIAVLCDSWVAVSEASRGYWIQVFTKRTLAMWRRPGLRRKRSFLAPFNLLQWIFAPIKYITGNETVEKWLYRITGIPLQILAALFENVTSVHGGWIESRVRDAVDLQEKMKGIGDISMETDEYKKALFGTDLDGGERTAEEQVADAALDGTPILLRA